MGVERISYELVKKLLKPPIRLVAATPPGFSLPEKGQYEEAFDSIDTAYAFFRQKRPKGRWILWLQGSDGLMIGLDSQKLEKAKEQNCHFIKREHSFG